MKFEAKDHGVAGTLCMIGIAGALCLVCGCKQQLDKPILFKIPKGFKGLIAIVVDKEKGALIESDGQVYEIVIPADGRLSVRDLRIFAYWHAVFAEYDDGMPIAIAAKVNDQGIVAFHSLPYVSYHKNGKEEVLYYFVGTKAESDKAQSKL